MSIRRVPWRNCYAVAIMMHVLATSATTLSALDGKRSVPALCSYAPVFRLTGRRRPVTSNISISGGLYADWCCRLSGDSVLLLFVFSRTPSPNQAMLRHRRLASMISCSWSMLC